MIREQVQKELNEESLKRDKAAYKWLIDHEEGRWFLTRLFESAESTPEGRMVVSSIKSNIIYLFGTYGKKQLLKGQCEALELEEFYNKFLEEGEHGRNLTDAD